MGEFYELYVLLAEPIDAASGIALVHRTILAAGGEIDGDCSFLLDGDDDEPRPVTDVDSVLGSIASNPRRGLVEYFYVSAFVTVTFLSEQPGPHLDGIRCSIPERAFEHGGDELRHAVEALAAQLHVALTAKRTVMDWGLEARGFSWRDELARLRAGQVVGAFAIVDIVSSETRA